MWNIARIFAKSGRREGSILIFAPLQVTERKANRWRGGLEGSIYSSCLACHLLVLEKEKAMQIRSWSAFHRWMKKADDSKDHTLQKRLENAEDLANAAETLIEEEGEIKPESLWKFFGDVSLEEFQAEIRFLLECWEYAASLTDYLEDKFPGFSAHEITFLNN